MLQSVDLLSFFLLSGFFAMVFLLVAYVSENLGTATLSAGPPFWICVGAWVYLGDPPGIEPTIRLTLVYLILVLVFCFFTSKPEGPK